MLRMKIFAIITMAVILVGCGATATETTKEAPATEDATEAQATEDATEAPATEDATEAQATEDATEAQATEDATEAPATEDATEAQATEQATTASTAETAYCTITFNDGTILTVLTVNEDSIELLYEDGWVSETHVSSWPDEPLPKGNVSEEELPLKWRVFFLARK